jgi:hypothetical protein
MASLYNYTFLFLNVNTELRPCHTIAYRTSVWQRITHTLENADIR